MVVENINFKKRKLVLITNIKLNLLSYRPYASFVKKSKNKEFLLPLKKILAHFFYSTIHKKTI